MFDSAPTPLDRRVKATQELLDGWKGRPYDFAHRIHCARMTAEHLRRMGRTPPLAKAGSYRTELGATRALRRCGVASLAEALDRMGLPRIAPAAAIVGDVVELPSASPLGCLTVALGNGRVLGFVDEWHEAAVLQPKLFGLAWRVDPLG